MKLTWPSIPIPVIPVSCFDVPITLSCIYNLLYINYLYILYKRLLSLILLIGIIGIGIDLAFIYHSLFFLSKAKEFDVNQGCVSPSESQVKIHRILNSRFSPVERFFLPRR